MSLKDIDKSDTENKYYLSKGICVDVRKIDECDWKKFTLTKHLIFTDSDLRESPEGFKVFSVKNYILRISDTNVFCDPVWLDL